MRLNIAQKIFGVAFVVLTLMVAVAVYSIKLTANIVDELDIVATRHLPATEMVTRINVNMLEQGIVLQRLFVRVEDEASHETVARDRARFEALGVKIEAEFEAAQELFIRVGQAAPELHEAIIALEAALTAIEREYLLFEDHGLQLVAAREAMDQALFETRLAALDEQEDAIDAEITDSRRQVEALTDAAVLRAEEHEKNLLAANIILTALAAVLGLGFATMVTRAIVRAVRDLVAGTAAVESGNLDTEVQVTSRDEVGCLTGSFNHMVGELRLKERIKDTFGKYMDPRIVANLLENPDVADLSGERREMTVMFIDLKGFTSIAEALAPDDLVKMINRFFGHMTDAISENNGVVDKFMGDAVMAFWGPPFTGADEQAGLACKAAVQALERLELFRRDIRNELGAKADGLDIDLRIGISTGEMIVGTVGSRVSMSFTIMGDPVNLGARLEGANKAYGTRAIISERTRELAGNDIAVRELDLIRVKGKSEPTRVYELQSLRHEQPALPAPICQHFPSGLAAYRRQSWDCAATAFNACLESNSEDPAAAVYLDRISQLRTTPLPTDWDGVWEFETK